MIPPDEFAANAARTRRRLALVFIAFLPATVLIMLLAAVGGSLLAKVVPSASVDNFFAILFPLFLVGLLGALFWIDRKAASLRCPHCRASLKQQPNLTIATRNCYQCGRRVLTEPSASEATSHLNRDELHRIAESHAWREIWLVLGVFAALIACLGAFAAARSTLTEWLGEYLPELAAHITVLAIPAVGAIAILGFYLWCSCRARRDPRATCPHCGESLALAGCTITGCCGCCGRTAVVGEPTAEQAEPLRDFEEFRAAAAHYHGRGMARTLALALGPVIAGALLSLAIVALSGMWDRDAVQDLSTTERTALGIAAFVPSALGYISFFVVMMRLERRTAADARLQCPACKAGLIRAHAIVIATRHCPKCRRRILTEPLGQVASDNVG